MSALNWHERLEDRKGKKTKQKKTWKFVVIYQKNTMKTGRQHNSKTGNSQIWSNKNGNKIYKNAKLLFSIDKYANLLKFLLRRWCSPLVTSMQLFRYG